MCDACPQAYHVDCLTTEPDPTEVEWTCQDDGMKCARRKTAKTQDTIWKPHEKGEVELGDDDSEFAVDWVGKGQRRTGRLYYTSVRVGGTLYTLGDDVHFDSEEGKEDIPWVGQLRTLWSDEWGDWCEIRWYFAPEQTVYGRLTSHGKDEVFTSAHVDDNKVSIIRGKSRILSHEEYKEAKATKKYGKERIFYARKKYTHDTGEFRAIIGQSFSPTKKRKTKGQENNEDDEDTSSSTTTANKFAQASSNLQLSMVPERLPCREEEHDTIFEFLKEQLRGSHNHQGASLYISGLPGTGKTASVLQCVRELKSLVGTGEVCDFDFVELNAMKLPSPKHAYTVLCEAITGYKASTTKAHKLLEARFSKKGSSRRKFCVVMIDELDWLVDKQQMVIYNLFNWLGVQGSRLVIVGIANTMDLPERFVPRVFSRLNLHRLTFEAYTRQQLQEIIRDRVKDLDVFDDVAIEFCARKVAGAFGDVRRALTICRYAAEIREKENNNNNNNDKNHNKKNNNTRVNMGHVTAAVKAMLRGDPHIDLLRGCRLYEKIFLCAVVKQNSLDPLPLTKIHNHVGQMCRARGLPKTPSVFELQQICQRMYDAGAVDITSGHSSVLGDWGVVLRVERTDVQYALQECDMCCSLLC